MNKIKIKLLITVSLIIILSTSILGFYNYKESEQIAMEIIKNNNHIELKNIKDYYFDELILDMEYIVKVWSQKEEIYNYNKDPNTEKIVKSIPKDFENIHQKWLSIVESSQDITWLYYASQKDGSIYIAPVDKTMPKSYDARDRKWYQGTLDNQNRVYWTKPYIDAGDSNKLLQTVSKAVYDKSGKLKGVIGLDIELSKFTEIIKNLSYSRNSNVFLINQNGNIVGHNLKNNTDFYQKIIRNNKKVKGSKILNEYSNQYVYSSVDIKLNNWKLVSVTKTNLQKNLNDIRNQNIFMVLFSTLAGIFIAIYFANNLLNPLNELTRVTDEIIKGNFNVKSNVKSNDEFYKLSKSFNNMVKKIKNLLEQRDENYINTIKAIANAIEASDAYTRGHCDRVGEISLLLAKDLNLSNKRKKRLKLACILHDVGKIGISDDILNKPGSLTLKEYEEIKKHSEIGYDIISEISFLKIPAKILLQHHERIDGSGYPNQLKGDEILLEAKILSVADAYDAMSSKRVYRSNPLRTKQIIKELKSVKGTQFDSKIVDLLIKRLINDSI
ncbi:MAG: HD domain-containing phosphohydrolase [Bacillota bacterium]